MPGDIRGEVIGTAAAMAIMAALMPAATNAETTGAAKPALVINDPFAAPLWRIDVDAEEKLIVAGSPAKAAAVFPIDNPKQPDLLRVPLREEEMQRAHAVAISPDGKRVAYGVPPLRDARGFAKPGTAIVYVFEREEKRIVKAIDTDMTTRAQALRFSPDGTYLAATLSDGCGLRVWRTSDWSLAAKDDQGYGGAEGCCPAGAGGDCDRLPDTTGLAFGRDAKGALTLVTSGDTGVRAYSVTGEAIAITASKTTKEIGLERPEAVAFSPDGGRLAVADSRWRGAGAPVLLQVAVLDAKTLLPVREALTVPDSALLSPAFLDPRKVPAGDQMGLNRVAWLAADGRETIVAGGMLWCQILDPALVTGTSENEMLDNCMVGWNPGKDRSADKAHFMRVGVERVMDIAALPQRKAVAYATQQRVAVIGAGGEPVVNAAGEAFLETGRALDARDRPLDAAQGKWLGFDISDDASVVYIEDYRGTAAAPIGLKFDVGNLRLERAGAAPEGVTPANRDPFVIDATANWWNLQRAPVVYGLALDEVASERDTYRSVALGPEQRAVIASANFLRVAAYDGPAARVACQLRVAAEAYRVAVSKDGTLAVAAHGDGTLRWYRIAAKDGGKSCDLEPVLAVHIRQTEWGRDDWTWTAWVPATGKFASDGRARQTLGWQVEDTNGQVSLVRFADLLKFYAPNEVRTALKQKPPAPEAVASLEKSIREAVDPVRLMVLAPDDEEDIDTEVRRFDVMLGAGGAWPRKLFVTIDGSTRAAKRYAGSELAANDPVEIAAPGIAQIDVALPASARRMHRNVQVCFQLDRQQSCRTVNWTGPLAAQKGRALRAVIVGFSDYAKSGMALPYAQNDALDLAKLFVADYKARVVEKTSKLAPDFDRVEIDLFVAPTTASAKADMDALAASGIVRLREPSVAALRSTLKSLATEAASGDGDLFLFYFSGHGILNTYREGAGLTALLDPGIGEVTEDAIATHALASDELIQSLEPIGADKLVILDACRTAAGATQERAFDPAAVSLEFERQLLSADVLFSAAPGQFSLDQAQYAYDDARPAADRGNGLFTYAVLRSLTEREPAAAAAGSRKVEAFDIYRYVRHFFDPADGESAAQKLVRMLQSKGMSVGLQQPMFVPARRGPGATTVVRTIE